MSSMRLNTLESVTAARKLLAEFNGDWRAVRAAGHTTADGSIDLTRAGRDLQNDQNKKAKQAA